MLLIKWFHGHFVVELSADFLSMPNHSFNFSNSYRNDDFAMVSLIEISLLLGVHKAILSLNDFSCSFLALHLGF